ncbi:Caspase-1 [Chionoecetes opilio]|uniref:Caspase-1 n=1 Tax=Chionoecetes opilio TaxID=41210 RepID=A0A8J5CI27_CHIOP|nr:Caspase-1 [Chionoecetes opilio]
MSVGRDALFYKNDHERRGQAIIFAHEKFDDLTLSSRECASHDTAISRRAFEHLGFEVMVHRNLTKANFEQKLQEVSRQDHQASDCLVVVFMSHGNVSCNNKEFLWTRDGKVDTSELWKNFTPDKCPSLAGKPKLFFIQACRDENIDKGVAMKRHKRSLKVQTDSISTQEDYVIPLHADMLRMWASYPGVDGAWQEYGSLLPAAAVTREVAAQYDESCTGQSDLLHRNNKTPYMGSTLMRHLYFPV